MLTFMFMFKLRQGYYVDWGVETFMFVLRWCYLVHGMVMSCTVHTVHTHVTQMMLQSWAGWDLNVHVRLKYLSMVEVKKQACKAACAATWGNGAS